MFGLIKLNHTHSSYELGRGRGRGRVLCFLPLNPNPTQSLNESKFRIKPNLKQVGLRSDSSWPGPEHLYCPPLFFEGLSICCFLKDHVFVYILARVILEFGDMDSGGGCGDDGAY